MRVSPDVLGVLIGFAAALSFVAGLFFVRFWKRSSDRFFLIFAAAFLLLAAQWILVAVIAPDNETRPLFYLLRAAAFLLIIFAIIDKNRKNG